MNELLTKLHSDIRDLKLKLILNEIPDFEINMKKLKKGNNWIFNVDYWNILTEWKGRAIITGSLALYAFELLDRKPNDIDLIVDENNFKPKKQLLKGNYLGVDGGLLGHYTQSGYNIDFFNSKNNCIFEKDGFLFHHPIEIMLKKLDMISQNFSRRNNKDIHDIINIMKKIQPDYQI